MLGLRAVGLSVRRHSPRSLHSLPQLRLDANREEMLTYFNNSWDLTEQIYAGLRDVKGFYTIPYHKLRHPFVFYIAHSAALYDNKFHRAGLIEEKVNADFGKLFEAGVDEMSWDNMHNHDLSVWPPFEEVRQYRRQVHEMVTDVVKNHPCIDGPRTMENKKFWAIVMGFEHEKIHMETSSVLMREMPLEQVSTPDGWPIPHDQNYSSTQTITFVPEAGRDYPGNAFIKVDSTKIKLGKPKEFPSYGWDNSYGEEFHHVRPFSANENLISNGEFYQFIADGGYETKRYWGNENSGIDSWEWVQFSNVKMPTFWRGSLDNKKEGLHLRMIFEEVPMQWDWPVIVNYHEAKAYSKWKTEKDSSDVPYRLITEKEHNAMRSSAQGTLDGVSRVDAVMLDGPHEANINLSFGSESSVTAFAPNDKGFRDVFGNVWQWCEDHFHPLQGFKIHELYHDFSTPCFDAVHFMMLGGSFISTGDSSSIFSRSHFRPHFYQHAGFRLAKYEDNLPQSSAVNIQL